MLRWLVRSRRERVLGATLLVAALAVSGAVVVRLWLNSQSSLLTPLTRHELAGETRLGFDPGDMLGIDGTDRRGFYPGLTKQIRVTITNAYDFDIAITEVWARLDATSDQRCMASSDNLQVGRYQGTALPLQVLAGTEDTLGVVPVTMPMSVDQACVGVQFTISLHGRAEKSAVS